MTDLTILADTSSIELAKKVSRAIDANVVKSLVKVFPDGESKITLKGQVSKKKSIVIKSIYPPVDTNLVQALSLISKANEVSSDVVAVIPYMGYARQDKEFLPGEIITSRVLGQLFKGVGASRLITVDIHSVLCLEHFKIKTKNVTAMLDMVQYFKKLNLKNSIIASPDQGGKFRAKQFAKKLGTEFVVLEKNRDRKTGKVQIKTKSMDIVKGRDVIIVDDMISTGSSIIKATQFFKRQKCKNVHAACTHALLINNAERKMKRAGVSKIISTNTIPGKTSLVDISSTIANVLM